jgi:hypothetical protein
MRLKPTMGWFGRDPQLEALLVELRASYNLVCVAAFWWDNTLTREYVVLS